MKRPIFTLILLTAFIAAFASGGQAQRIRAFEITGRHFLHYGGHNVGALFITVGGSKRKIADEAAYAWALNGGREIVYSAGDGSGGFENVGQSLRIYDMRTGKTRKILSEYFSIAGISEVKLTTGARVLLVRGGSGERESLSFAVVDPKRGEVFALDSAELIKVKGDLITLIVGRDDAIDFEPDENDHTAFALPRRTAPRNVKKYDLRRLIKRKVIYNRHSEEPQDGGMM